MTNNNNIHHDDFEDDPVDPPYKVRVHRMPFQRRTLSYWTGIRYGSRSVRCSRRRIRHGKQQRHVADTTTTPTTTRATGTRTKHQKLDLLNVLWQHRVRNYNDAFLPSPRRNTRNYYAKANTPPVMKVLGSPMSHSSPDSTAPADRHTSDRKKKKQQQQQTTPTRASHGCENKKGSSNTKHYVEENKTVSDSGAELGGPDLLSGTQIHGPNIANTSVDNTAPRSSVAAALVSESGNSTALENSDHRHRNNSTPISEIEDMNDLLDWKERFPGAEAQHRESVDFKARVLFHFLFVNEDQKPCFLTDATPENYAGHRRCIFCYFDGGSDAGLLMHCVTCHGQFLSFKAARSEDGTVGKTLLSTCSSLCALLFSHLLPTWSPFSHLRSPTDAFDSCTLQFPRKSPRRCLPVLPPALILSMSVTPRPCWPVVSHPSHSSNDAPPRRARSIYRRDGKRCVSWWRLAPRKKRDCNSFPAVTCLCVSTSIRVPMNPCCQANGMSIVMTKRMRGG